MLYLKSTEYFWQFRECWFFINKLFSIQVTKLGPIKANSEICTKDSLSMKLLHPLECFLKFPEAKLRYS